MLYLMNLLYALPPDAEDALEHFTHNFELAEITKLYLRKHLRLSRGRINKQIELSNFIHNLFEDSLKNIAFCHWLCKEIRLSFDEFSELLSHRDKKRENEDKRYKKLSLDLVKNVHEFWKQHSVISVHRSNDRNKVNIAARKLHPSVELILKTDENVSINKNMQLSGHRYIYTKPIRKLHTDLVKEYQSISYGLFYQLKPFYIVKPSEKERESCMCSTCLNIHIIYDLLRKHMSNRFPKSTTEYLKYEFKCERIANFGFFSLNYISGNCTSHYELKNENLSFTTDIPQKYYQFERVTEEFYNKRGTKCTDIRTAKINKEASLSDLYILLQQIATKYLIHRFFISADSVLV